MLQLEAPIIAIRTPATGLRQIVLGSAQLAQAAQPGQFIAVRMAYGTSTDPLLRTALPLAGIDRTVGTVTLLVRNDTDQLITQRHVGDTLDLLGPLGHGWPVANAARNVLLLGTADAAASLLVLVETAVSHNLAITLLIGAPIGPGLPANLVPSAVEYHLGRSLDPTQAALDLLDDDLLRWADAIYTALPVAAWLPLVDRIRRTRIRWDRGVAYAYALPPLPCAVGVCGTCALPIGNKRRLVCVDGPVFDLRDTG